MARLLAIAFSVLALAVVILFANPTPAPANGPFDQQPAVAGPGCTRNSECAAGLVCRASRCAEACREDRDCGPAQHCVLLQTGIHACQVDQPSGPLPPDAAYCTSRRDCTSGACDSGQQCHGG